MSTLTVVYCVCYKTFVTSRGPNSEELWVWLRLLITSIIQRDICVLTACPRAEQIPCICNELMGTYLVSLLFASGMSLGL